MECILENRGEIDVEQVFGQDHAIRTWDGEAPRGLLGDKRRRSSSAKYDPRWSGNTALHLVAP